MAIKIAIDAGHGSNTAGKRTAPFAKDVDIDGDGKIDIKKGEQYREHYACVMVCDLLNKELTRCGFSTYKSAWNDTNAKDDVDIPLGTRQKNIKAAKCDYSVSIHFNAHGDGRTFTTGKGIETLIHSNRFVVGDSKRFADIVQAHLIKGSPQANRGVKQMELALCNCTNLGTKASILVELAFMTNDYEAQELMANVKFCKECAVEICKGICEYTGVKYVEVGKNTVKPVVNTPTKVEEKTKLVKITTDTLNVRKDPNSSSQIVTTVKRNQVYTIVEEKGAWLKLKSGAGWINSKYVEVVK